MSGFVITEHAIVPRQYIAGVTVMRTTPDYNDDKPHDELYSIMGHSIEGQLITLYVDLKHADIPTKMTIVAGQLSGQQIPLKFSGSVSTPSTSK